MMYELDLNDNCHKETIEPNTNLSGDSLEKELIDRFNFSISSIKEKFQLLELDISEELKSNILRSQVSLLLSAVDFYIHEIIKIELLNIIKRERASTASLKNCMISIHSLLEYLSSSNINNEILENEIVYRNSFKSFLEPNKMAEALSLITNIKIFNDIYPKLNFQKQKDLTDKMREIFQRRNFIVHQMDYDYLSKSQKEITKTEVEEYIDFYHNFIKELHKLLLEENVITTQM